MPGDMDARVRESLIHRIARILDGSSLHMGGPSFQNRGKAASVLNELHRLSVAERIAMAITNCPELARLRDAAENVATAWALVKVTGGALESGKALSKALDGLSNVLDEIADAEDADAATAERSASGTEGE